MKIVHCKFVNMFLLLLELYLIFKETSCDHLRGMMLTARVIEENNGICKTHVELNQVWQTFSNFASRQCKKRSGSTAEVLHKYSPKWEQIQLWIKCNQLTKDETSPMISSVTDTTPCETRVKYYVSGCCWIPHVEKTAESAYDTTFTLDLRKRKDGSFNRPPQAFIPPALRVPINMKETSTVDIFDPEFDKFECKSPIKNQDCKNCSSIDSINSKYKGLVTINKDCTITTDFKSEHEKMYFRVMFVIEEYEKGTGKFLSKGSYVLLMIPAELKCGERGQTTMEIEPNDPKYIPGKTYTLITKTKPPCGEVSYKKSIFSVVPPGSRVSDPLLKDGMVTQNMTFVANDNLCVQMMQICAYSMDADNFQSKTACEQIFCRGYEHLLGESPEAAARRKRIIGGSIAGLLLLLLLAGLLGFILWKRSRRGDDDEDYESSNASSVSEEPPKPSPEYTTQKKDPKSSAMSSMLDDDDDD